MSILEETLMAMEYRKWKQESSVSNIDGKRCRIACAGRKGEEGYSDTILMWRQKRGLLLMKNVHP